MKFSEVVNQAISLLRREGRVSYRALKLELDVTDEQLEALKDELIDAKRLAVNENGKVLVWVGEQGAKSEDSPASRVQSRASNTPPSPDARRQTLAPSTTPTPTWMIISAP